MPVFELLAEHNVRQGFVTPAEFEKIVAALPDYVEGTWRGSGS